MAEKQAKPASRKAATAKPESTIATVPKTTRKAAPSAKAKPAVSAAKTSSAATASKTTPARKPAVKKVGAGVAADVAREPGNTKVAAKTELPSSPSTKGTAAAKKAPAKQATATKTTAAKTTAAKTTARRIGHKTAVPNAEQRHQMVQTAAYYIAERLGFCGHPDEHWTKAELEIAAKFGL